MIKVYQKLVDRNIGDCMQAATASLLELPYDSVPKFVELPDGWIKPLMNLVEEQGYSYEGMLHNRIDKTDMVEEYMVSSLHKHEGVNGYFMASVYSPKYFNEGELDEFGRTTTHAVIIDKNFNIVHDPNPNNKNIVAYPLSNELGYNGILNIMLINKK